MMKLMVTDSDEYQCLHGALKSVEKVADYINEMQRISETYTPIFQEMCEEYIWMEVMIPLWSKSKKNKFHKYFKKSVVAIFSFANFFLFIRILISCRT